MGNINSILYNFDLNLNYSRIIIESGEVQLDRSIIFDLTGRSVIDERVDSNRSELIMKNKGIYFVKLIRKSGVVRICKLVVW